MRIIILASAAFLLVVAPFAHGHGVIYGIFEGHAVAVYFGYAGGEPMSYAKAKVFGPNSSSDLEFQNGRTDARGIFAFVPDQPGSWRVEAWDTLGHKGSIELTIKQEDATLTAVGFEDSVNNPALIKIVLALSLIVNLAFAFYLIKRPKHLK